MLARKLGFLYIDLAGVVKREKLTSGYDRQRRTLIADLSSLAKRVQQIVKHHDDDVVIDGHYAEAVVPKKLVTKVFVLRCHPRQLRQQMEKRGFKDSKLWENLAAEILDACLLEAVEACGKEKVCEIDVTGKSVENVVEGIISVLDGNESCRLGIVDWLGQLEQEKTLDSYLRW